MSSKNWANDSISKACITRPWAELVDTINSNVKRKVNSEGYSRFSELSEKDQALLIEREFHEMQQRNDPTLIRFGDTLNASIDEQLLLLLRENVNQMKIKSHSTNCTSSLDLDSSECNKPSNVNFLLATCSEAIMKVLSNTPDYMSTSWLLFLNRPLPLSLRPYLWYSKIRLESRIGLNAEFMLEHDAINMKGGGLKISPSLDMLYSRRVHVLLDNNFPMIASRSNASLIKSVISAYMREHNCYPSIALENNESENPFYKRANMEIEVSVGVTGDDNDMESQKTIKVASSVQRKRNQFDDSDLLFYILVPLLSCITPELLRGGVDQGHDMDMVSAYALRVGSRSIYAQYLDMNNIVTKPSIDGELERFHFSANSKDTNVEGKFDFSSVSLVEILSCAAQSVMDMHHLGVINTPGVFERHSPYLETTLELLKMKNVVYFEKLIDLSSVDDAIMNGSNVEGNIKECVYDNFSQLVDLMLKRGFSGFLSLETTLFVWDQCFITGFHDMLPVIAVALFLGCQHEIEGLKSLLGVSDTITAYTEKVTVTRLQKLLTTHCEVELKKRFSVQGTYTLQRDSNDILQALWQEIVPDQAVQQHEALYTQRIGLNSDLPQPESNTTNAVMPIPPP